jgi:hypothetical protein
MGGGCRNTWERREMDAQCSENLTTRNKMEDRRKWKDNIIKIFRHVSGVPWLIIMCSGLDDWIYWHLPLQSLITAHNQWLPKTRSFHYWTTSVFSSTATDLDLIYESATSSTNAFSFTDESWRLTQSITCPPFITWGEPNKDHYPSPPHGSSTIPCLSVAAETCVNSETTLWVLQAYPLPRKRD